MYPVDIKIKTFLFFSIQSSSILEVLISIFCAVYFSLTCWKPTRAKHTVKQLKSMYDFHISLTWWKPTRDERTVKQLKSTYDTDISLTWWKPTRAERTVKQLKTTYDTDIII